MPETVNGCGTWYYGKKNLQQYQGVCRSCGAVTTLSSYDTRLYVVVVFIPVIPLRRKRIIEQCAACTRHGVMPLDNWRRAEKRSSDAIAAYRASPQDRELAKEALGACAGYRNLPAFMDLAPDVERHLSRDGEALRMTAAAYDGFGRAEDAERVLRAALAAQDEDETREMLADCLLRQGRPHDAQPLLSHVVEQGIPDRVESLYQLAQGFQIKGDHAKALEVFQQCETVNPHIAQDDTFVRLRDESARRLGTHVPVQPGKVVSRAKRAAGFRKAARVAPVVLALALVAYGALCYVQGRRRAVYLVNGLYRPYEVRVNGQTHKLYPRAAKEVRVAEGEVTVEMVDPPVPMPAETATVRTSFLTRPFSGATFVINPDRAAVVQKTRMYYQSERSGSAPRPPEYEFAAGGLLHRFDGVDYPFEQFPDTIKLDSNSRSVARSGLTLPEEEPLTIAATVAALTEQLGPGPVREVVTRHALLEPERSEYLAALKLTMKPEERAEFLRAGLGRRPTQVHWHRAYQDALTSVGEDERAEREYAAMLIREPGDKELLYLAGRATIDIDQAVALHRRATEGPSASPYAHFALCGYHLAAGEFRDAAAHADKALHMLPGEAPVRWYCRQALLADGQYDRVIAMLDEDQAGPVPLAVAAAAEEVALRTALSRGPRGDAADHRAQVDRTVQFIATRLTDYAPAVLELHKRRFEAMRAYCSGDAAAFVKLVAEEPDPADQFPAHLTAGDVAAAAACIEKSDPEAEHHLLVYLAAKRTRNDGTAEAHLKAAIDLLAKGDYELRQFGKALAGAPPLPLDQMLRLRSTPREKVVLLAALGVQNPAWRGECFALARKLNYDRRFPHLLLEDLFNQLPAGTASR